VGVASITGGAGQAVPVTGLGKVVGGFISLLRVALFAVPSGILASGFVEEARRRRNGTAATTCPHCGNELV
jgi:voltage-gated potassium channel